MQPILYESTETEFKSNGLGRLDPISCTVTEERNGQYELEMVVSIDDDHYADIAEGRILYVRHNETDDKQPFDIYYISRPINGEVTVLAHHISYRTCKITVMPFEASGIGLALMGLINNSIGTNPFTVWTNKSVSSKYKTNVPKTMRSLLAGEQGSILDVFGTGEYEWDKFEIKLHLKRGTDSGVVLRYGKDIIDLKKTTDSSSLWTGVAPYWYGTNETEDNGILVTLPEKCIMAANASTFGNDKIVPLDLSSDFDAPPTEDELRLAANKYITDHQLSEIPTNIEFSFINLAANEEFKNVAVLQRLSLCDTLTIKYDKLGVSNTAKIVQTVYDVLGERYLSMTVGEASSGIASTLTSGLKKDVSTLKATTSKKLTKLEEDMLRTLDEQTKMITGDSGGYVVLDTNETDEDGNPLGYPTRILIMDSPDKETALNVLQINKSGIGFSKRGINGPYDSAWTIDGKFSANYIQTGELNAALIKTGAITDAKGYNYWNMETGEFRLAANTLVGADGTTDTVQSLLDDKSKIYYGTYREGSQYSYKPTASEKSLADGDMRYYSGYTYRYNGSSWVQLKSTDINAGDYLVDQYSGSTYKWSGSKWETATDYNAAITSYDSELDQEKVFNKLTNNGTVQGITMTNGNLYINASYINAGDLSANRIKGGTLTLGGSSNQNGTLVIKNSSNSTIGQWDKDGINIKSGTISLGNNFAVDSDGYMSCTGADIYSKGTTNGAEHNIKLKDGKISGGRYNNSTGYVSFVGIPDYSVTGTVLYDRNTLFLCSSRLAVIEGDPNSGSISINYGRNNSIEYISDITDNGNGTITWYYDDISFAHGLTL